MNRFKNYLSIQLNIFSHKKNDLLMHVATKINPKKMILNIKKMQKKHKLYYSIYMKYPQEANL